MQRRFCFFLPLILSCFGAAAQTMTAAEYVAKYKDIAILEMRRQGVPAAISLAQGLLETESGNSDLVKESNNHFGIKCKDNWNQASVTHDDDAPGECFRAYTSAVDSYRDHSDFLRNSERYSFLFNLNPRDYRDWAYGLKRAGYATNPRYAAILIKNIEDNNLEQYTDEAIMEGPLTDPAAIASAYAAVTRELGSDTTQSTSALAISAPQRLTSSVSPPAAADARNVTTDPKGEDPEPQPGLSSINGCKVIYATQGTSLLAIATQNHLRLGRLLQFNDLQQDGILERNQYIFLEKKQKMGDSDYCIVRPHETLHDISQRNGIQLESLCAYNHMTAYEPLTPGSRILLKPSSGVASSSGRSASSQETAAIVYHEVQHRESIYAISKKYSVSVDELKQWNHLRGNHVKPGQQLIISK